MDYDNIKELIEIINDSDLTSFELSIDNIAVKMSKNSTDISAFESPIKKDDVVEKINTVNHEVIKTEKRKTDDVKGNIIKAPIVGTVYLSKSPDKPNFVAKGSKVKQGDILCIVEAMKIMNEIVSTFDGEIAEVYVQNETLVEYGQELFKIV